MFKDPLNTKLIINTKELLDSYNKAKAVALDSSTYSFENSIKTISAIYSDWKFNVPKRFVEYNTTLEAIKDYQNWKDEVKSLPTNWMYKFPFTIPHGIWTYIYSDRLNYHLGYRRTGASVKSELNVSEGSVVVTRDFIHEIYSFLYKEISKAEIEELGKNVKVIMEVDNVMDELEQKLLKEDEYGITSGDELFILGNNDVMIFEVAVCNYLIKEHNVKYYDTYVKYINDMIKYCGICFAFDDICIVCKK